MWWECGECGHRLMRERPLAVCPQCGRAGATIAAEPAVEAELDGSRRDAWLRAGFRDRRFRTCMHTRWAGDAA
jgi:hypothetical protein